MPNIFNQEVEFLKTYNAGATYTLTFIRQTWKLFAIYRTGSQWCLFSRGREIVIPNRNILLPSCAWKPETCLAVRPSSEWVRPSWLLMSMDFTVQSNSHRDDRPYWTTLSKLGPRISTVRMTRPHWGWGHMPPWVSAVGHAAEPCNKRIQIVGPRPTAEFLSPQFLQILQ